MSYTKGPWHLHAGVMGDTYGVWSRVEDKPIAKDVSTTNAQLIAAAPELLEACEIALQFIEATHKHTDKDMYETIYAAIAKAKGVAK